MKKENRRNTDDIMTNAWHKHVGILNGSSENNLSVSSNI